MPRAMIFWVLMLLWLILGLYWYWPVGVAGGAAYIGLGLPLLIFVLLALLGWQVFGPAVKG